MCSSKASFIIDSSKAKWLQTVLREMSFKQIDLFFECVWSLIFGSSIYKCPKLYFQTNRIEKILKISFEREGVSWMDLNADFDRLNEEIMLMLSKDEKSFVRMWKKSTWEIEWTKPEVDEELSMLYSTLKRTHGVAESYRKTIWKNR